MQYYAQQAIEYFRGAIVVMEVDTGRIIAMASGPDFDPNLFDPENKPNKLGGLTQLIEQLEPTASQPRHAGTVSAWLGVQAHHHVRRRWKAGLYLKDTPYDCQYEFKELGDRTLYDWT